MRTSSFGGRRRALLKKIQFAMEVSKEFALDDNTLGWYGSTKHKYIYYTEYGGSISDSLGLLYGTWGAQRRWMPCRSIAHDLGL